MGRKKEDNLIPFTSEQNREEAKKNGRKGGIASGESRRQRKLLKEQMQMLLELPVTNKKVFDKMSDFGIAIDEIDNSTRLVYSLLLKAFTGDVNAIKEARNMSGENDNADILAKLDTMLSSIEDKL